MKKKIWQLTVRSEFCAGHALRNYEGKCEKMHGHNFEVEVVVQGEKLDNNIEYLIDFKVLKSKLNNILDDLDHCILNETTPFHKINPTSENLAQYIYLRMQEGLAEYEVEMYSATVSEKSAQKATYKEIST